MSNEVIRIDEPPINITDITLDAEGVTVGGTFSFRERTEIAGSTPTGIADVLTTDPISTTPGLIVRDYTGSVLAGYINLGNANSTFIASRIGQTLFVMLDPGHTLGKVDAGIGTFNVQFDPGHTLGNIGITSIGTANTLSVYLPDTGHELGSIKGINSSLAIVPQSATGSALSDDNYKAVRALIVGSQSNASLAVTVSNAPTITGITNSINVYLGATAGTIRIGDIPGSVAVYFSPSNPAVAATFSGTVGVNIGKVDGTIQTVVGRIDDSVAIKSGTLTGITNSIAVYFDRGNPSVNATFSGTMEVIPTTGSRKITDDASASQRVLIVGSQTNASLTINGTVTANAGTGTMTVQFDPGHTLGNIGTVSSITNTIAVDSVTATGGQTMDENYKAQRVLIVGSSTNSSLVISGTVTANAGTGTMTVQFDPGHELGTIRGNTNTLTVFLPDTGHEIGTIRGNTNTLTVFLPDTGHTIGKFDAGLGTFGVNIGKIDGTIQTILDTRSSISGIQSSVAIHLLSTGGTIITKIDPAGAVFINAAYTASIFSVSGSTSGVSVSGVQLVAPSAFASFKVFAFSLQTTGIVSLVARFTNGAGTSPTEYWRGLVTANQTNSTPIGANLAINPPGHFFATGINTTLALLLDTATLVHYSVSYIKETL